MSNQKCFLPTEGFVRLPDVLKVIPVSRASWYQGIKSGKYPKPRHLGPKTAVWRVEDIRTLIDGVDKNPLQMADGETRGKV